MAAALKKSLASGGVFLLVILLLAQVGSMTALCLHAFKLNLTLLGYAIPLIVLIVFFVGWLHLHWGRYTRRAFAFSLIVVTASFALLAEVGFMAGLCVYAFKLNLTRLEYTIPPIVIFMLLVGWLPLILRRYTRRAFVFDLLVMTASFAISCMMASVLIVGRPLPLKLPAIVLTSWLTGGLCGWVIVYLDRQWWRLGESLGMAMHGFGPMYDRRSRRPLVTVIMISLLAVLVCAVIWHYGREEVWRDLWREPGYHKRLRVAWNFVEFRWFQNEPEEKINDFLGQPRQQIFGDDPIEHLACWLIGTAPPGATSFRAGENAYLCVRIRNDRVVSSFIVYKAGNIEAGDITGDR